jgi:hypothetical protein
VRRWTDESKRWRSPTATDSLIRLGKIGSLNFLSPELFIPELYISELSSLNFLTLNFSSL